MTVQEAIDRVDKLRPNQYDTETKTRWLSNLDGMIFREVIITHEHPHCTHFNGHSCPDDELLVKEPYAGDIYNFYLQMQIDKENAEYKRYNQSVTMYNNAYQTFQDWYNRTHRPLPARAHFVY